MKMIGRKHTQETIEKMKISNSGKNNGMYGKHFSDETKLKMRLKKLGKPSNRKGKKLSQESKDKISNANTGKKRTLEVRIKFSESRKGNKSWSWKGGISKENHLFRNSLINKIWRKSCFERDNFTCKNCFQNGGDLVVHHINNFSEFPELRLNIENGITLCKKCHKEFHKKYNYKNNSREQLNQFINNK